MNINGNVLGLVRFDGISWLMVQGRMVSVKLEKLTTLGTHSFVLVTQ